MVELKKLSIRAVRVRGLGYPLQYGKDWTDVSTTSRRGARPVEGYSLVALVEGDQTVYDLSHPEGDPRETYRVLKTMGVVRFYLIPNEACGVPPDRPLNGPAFTRQLRAPQPS